MLQPAVQSTLPNAPTCVPFVSKKPSLGGVAPPVNAGEPAKGMAFGLFKLKGSARSTSLLSVKTLPPLLVNQVFIAAWKVASVDWKLVPMPERMLFLIYIAPDWASATVLAPSINRPVGQPIIRALLIKFCDDRRKCMPRLKRELISVLLVAFGPINVTFQ